MIYSTKQKESLYALGRMYLELGYLIPAERIFNGIVSVDKDFAAAGLGLGMARLERGLQEEAVSAFRQVLEVEGYAFEARLGMCLAFIAQGEEDRAASVLKELYSSGMISSAAGAQRVFYDSLRKRCGL